MPRLPSKSFIIMVAAAALMAGCSDSAPDGPPQAPPPPSVTVATPLTKTITEWDEFTGRFEAVATVEVRARVSGPISTVYFEDGKLVNKGDLLLVIEREAFEIEVARAKAEVKQAEARLQLAITEVDRAAPLVAKGTIPKSEFDARLSRKRAAEGAVEEAEAALRAAELSLKWTEVRAPISGRISDIRVDAGNLVSGGQTNATLLTTLVSVDPIYFVFEGSETDYLKYSRLARAGRRLSSREAANPVAVRLADEADFVHEGKMNFVDNVVDVDSGTIRGRAIFDNDSLLLLPGMFGRMRLFGGKSDALLIPDAAIASDLANKIVLTVDDAGTVVQKTVRLGPIVDGLRVVRSGITAADRVVIRGLQRARPGMKVAPEPGKIEPPRATSS